ncbi:serpentine type 7TM GPCR chemoreceptor srh domain-containing protein [Ditylenchus destructor]|uniref:Serpentine type 7TM GPCR chemoreceptor srh domain-containing protein n=1 Tax=Ditylenchus destructor TaxID=166010 RepID=A0AAD4N2Z1_9BILA|nr:serpentine type 7TM GPCR chemoreceptor srh domain-containing protein [Ditylenchus destructor]
MAQYRYFLCLTSIWDLIFSALLGYGLHPRLLFPLSAAEANGLFNSFGHIGAKTCLVFFAAVNVIGSQFVCLGYRFVAVLPNQIFHGYYTKFISKLLWQLFCLSCALGYSIPLYSLLVPEDVESTFAYAKGIVIGFTTIELLSCAMAFCILRQLRKSSHLFSNKTYKLQNQLTLLLIIQLASPIVFIGIPVAAALLSNLMGSFALGSSSGEVGMIIISLYALNSSLLTILFVTPYRKYTTKFLSKWFNPRCRVKCRPYTSSVDQLPTPNVSIALRDTSGIIRSS